MVAGREQYTSCRLRARPVHRNDEAAAPIMRWLRVVLDSL